MKRLGAKTESIKERIAPTLPYKTIYLTVGEVRKDFRRRIREMSRKPSLTTTERLRSAYYQKVLTFLKSLRDKTQLHSGFSMYKHSSKNPEQVGQINEILSYLVPKDEVMAAYRWPISLASRKKGRPVTKRPAALQALQMQIDTGQTWSRIAQRLCTCPKTRHEFSCKERVRSDVNELKRLLRQLDIQLPARKERSGE